MHLFLSLCPFPALFSVVSLSKVTRNVTCENGKAAGVFANQGSFGLKSKRLAEHEGSDVHNTCSVGVSLKGLQADALQHDSRKRPHLDESDDSSV